MKGLYGKYIVRKRSDNSIVTNCFVLRPDRDDAAIAAMLAYADATSDSQLAQELREWAEYEQGVKPPVTNADHIRAMSDEELASEMSQPSISTVCDIVCQGDCKAIATLNKTCGDVCKEIIMKWLQQPAEDDT